LIELIHENNSYLDYVISDKSSKPLSILWKNSMYITTTLMI
jgi:hypothetical protein